MSVEGESGIWGWQGLIDAAKTIGAALLIALGIRTFLYQPFSIPSSSMEGTLLVGDYLFVSKYSYGYSRYSLPFADSLPQFGRVLSGAPKRGDVAVFRFPPDPDQDYIKRVVGLPGDRIQVKDAVLHINGAPAKLERAGDITVHCAYGVATVPAYRETLPDGPTHLIAQCDPAGPQNDTQEFVVPQGHYFMMGDNRDNSRDSRVPNLMGGVGFVPAENLIGRAQIIFFSTDGRAGLLEFWRWFHSIRYDRLLNGIG